MCSFGGDGGGGGGTEEVDNDLVHNRRHVAIGGEGLWGRSAYLRERVAKQEVWRMRDTVEVRREADMEVGMLETEKEVVNDRGMKYVKLTAMLGCAHWR